MAYCIIILANFRLGKAVKVWINDCSIILYESTRYSNDGFSKRQRILQVFFRKSAMVCPNIGVHLYIKACEVNRFVTVHDVNLH